MSEGIVDCIKENASVTYGDSTVVSVTLASEQGMSIDEKTGNVYLSFPGIYESLFTSSLTKMSLTKTSFDCTLPQLIELRKDIVETYYSATDNLYGNSMYLLEFQKKVIEAGHWEAYNYFIFMPSLSEDFDQWYSTHSADMDAFIEWYSNNVFKLGHGRSVDLNQIYKNARPLDLINALMITTKMIGDPKE